VPPTQDASLKNSQYKTENQTIKKPKSGPPPSCGGQAEGGPYRRKRTQERRPFDTPFEAQGKQGKQGAALQVGRE
jgi:hypothetical protein